jgi:hypothetical protein
MPAADPFRHAPDRDLFTMSLIGHLFRSPSKVSRVANGGHSARRNRAQFTLESLEARDLKSDIPGVVNQYGMLSIQGTQPSGNQAHVSIDSGHNNDLRVDLNGQSVWFNASEIWNISYNSASGGSDTFVNDTNINDTIVSNGNNNRFYGGGGYDSVYSYGDFTTIDTRDGSGGYIEAYNGPNNYVASHSNVYVYTASYDNSWFAW